jgi:hypothetical protein
MYISEDAGGTWHLIRHGASTYAGGIPYFDVRPDGSIVAGDRRVGLWCRSTGAPFREFTETELGGRLLGPLFVRGPRGSLGVSRDRMAWMPMTLSLVRVLLGGGA